MLPWFFKNKLDILGVDIQPGAINIVQVDIKPMLSIEMLCRATLPEGAVEANKIQDIQTVSETLSRLLNRAKIKCKNIALSMPTSAVLTKILQLDVGLNDDEIEQQLLLDAGRHIPYPIEEVRLDFQILNESKVNKEKVDVLLVVSHRELVDQRLEVLDGAGLKGKIVDVESYVIARTSEYVQDGEYEIPCVMLGLGEKHLSLTVVEQNSVTHQDEQLLRQSWQSEITADRIASWLNRSLQVLQISRPDIILNQVIVYGEHASAVLAGELSRSMSKAVSLANPFKHIACSKKCQHELERAHYYLPAFGLALRSGV